MDQSCLTRIERETSKFLEIDNIFYRLKSSESVGCIYNLFKNIFEKEHKFTIEVIEYYLRILQELANLAKMKNLSNKQFNFPEHYKLNSHIFKQNLALISNIIIEDIWFAFNRMVCLESFENVLIQKQKASLFQIEEEPQCVENQRTENEIEQSQLSSEQSKIKTDDYQINIMVQKEYQSQLEQQHPPSREVSPRTRSKRGSQSHRQFDVVPVSQGSQSYRLVDQQNPELNKRPSIQGGQRINQRVQSAHVNNQSVSNSQTINNLSNLLLQVPNNNNSNSHNGSVSPKTQQVNTQNYAMRYIQNINFSKDKSKQQKNQNKTQQLYHNRSLHYLQNTSTNKSQQDLKDKEKKQVLYKIFNYISIKQNTSADSNGRKRNENEFSSNIPQNQVFIKGKWSAQSVNLQGLISKMAFSLSNSKKQ